MSAFYYISLFEFTSAQRCHIYKNPYKPTLKLDIHNENAQINRQAGRQINRNTRKPLLEIHNYTLNTCTDFLTTHPADPLASTMIPSQDQ